MSTHAQTVVSSATVSSDNHNSNGLSYAAKAKKANEGKSFSTRTAVTLTSHPKLEELPNKEEFPLVSQTGKPSATATSNHSKKTISYAQASSHNLPKKHASANSSAKASLRQQQPSSSDTRPTAARQPPTFHRSTSSTATTSSMGSSHLEKAPSASRSGFVPGADRGLIAMNIHSSSHTTRGQNHERLDSGHILSSEDLHPHGEEQGHLGQVQSTSSGSSSLSVQPDLAPAHQALTATSDAVAPSTAPYENGYAGYAASNGYDNTYLASTQPHPHHFYSHLSGYSSSPGHTPPIMSPPYPYPPGMPIPFPVYMVPVFIPAPGYWPSPHSQPGSGHHTPLYPQYSSTTTHSTDPAALNLPNEGAQQYGFYNGHPSTEPEPDMRPKRGFTRPIRPEDSEPVAGYGVFDGERAYSAAGEPVVFGSIGTESGSGSLSPSLSRGEYAHTEIVEPIENEFASLSIGITPDDEDYPRLRSRSRTLSSVRSRTATVSDDGLLEVKEERMTGEEVVLQTIDLANPDKSHWEFGTIALPSDPKAEGLTRPASAPPHKNVAEDGDSNPLSRSYNAQPSSSCAHSGRESPVANPFPGSSSQELHMKLEELSTAPRSASVSEDANRDVFTVKDFGYGFGSGSRSPSEIPDSHYRWDRDPGRGEVHHGLRGGRDGEFHTRPRRGYQNQERGYYNGRRGRGNGYGRGNSRRGGGFQPNGHYRQSSFNTSPSGFMPTPPHHGNTTIQGGTSRAPPFFNPSGYSSQMTHSTNPRQIETSPEERADYTTSPAPITSVPFPLDPTRLRLLGLLEHYLSPQGMAADDFLQQQMSSEGWIPLLVFTTYGDISRYNADVSLIRDVLTLSDIVELNEDSVRMSNWEDFISSNKRRQEEQSNGDMPNLASLELDLAPSGSDSDDLHEANSDDEVEYETDDDEDVVIVINQEPL